MSRDYRLFLEDALSACAKVLRYSEGMDQSAWQANEMAYDATLRNLEIIGEAISHIPDEVRERYPTVEWRRIRAFRNVVTHDYFGIDNDIVWDVIENKVPSLLDDLRRIVALESDNPD